MGKPLYIKMNVTDIQYIETNNEYLVTAEGIMGTKMSWTEEGNEKPGFEVGDEFSVIFNWE